MRECDKLVQRARTMRRGEQGGQDVLRVRMQYNEGHEGQEGALGW